MFREGLSQGQYRLPLPRHEDVVHPAPQVRSTAPIDKETGQVLKVLTGTVDDKVEAVIDKDPAGERLAEVVNADIFLILTDVEKVKLNFGKPNEESIDKMNLEEAKKYLEEGHFLSGSMGPKMKACIRFLEWGGKKALITSL